jgi:hypothetical protein
MERISADSRKIEITFTERLLGTIPPRDAWEKFVLSKAPVPDDSDVLEEVDTVIGGDKNEGLVTRFHRDPDGIYLLDYQIKGFLKEGANVLKESLENARGGRASGKRGRSKGAEVSSGEGQQDRSVLPGKGIAGAKSKIDNFVFVFPRYIFLQEKADGKFARPLRAQTAQGPRVSMAVSEYVEAGRTIEITIDILPGCEIGWPAIERILDYGAYKGIGQFRNGSFGRFTWKYVGEKAAAVV